MRALVFLAALAGCDQPQGASTKATADKAPTAPAAQAGTAVAAPPNATDVVAKWKGGQVTYGDLFEEVNATLTRLQIDYLQGKYEAEKQALEGIVAEKLVEAEAKAQGVTLDELMEKEVQAKIATPTDAEIEEVYGVMKRRFGNKPLSEVRTDIVGMLESRNYGNRYGEFVAELEKKYKSKVTLPYPDLPRLTVSKDDDPVWGNPDAELTIIQFAEFQCPYCGKAKETVDKIIEDYGGKVNMVFRDFPLGFHDRAIPAAVAANCAGEQGKYWEMYDQMMANQRALAEEDLLGYAKAAEVPDLDKWQQCRKDPSQEAEVTKDMEDGQKVGVTGTPAFFINGVMISGAQPYGKFKEIIDRELDG